MYVLAAVEWSAALVRKEGTPSLPPSAPSVCLSVHTSHGHIVVASFIASPPRRLVRSVGVPGLVHCPLQKYGRSRVRSSVRHLYGWAEQSRADKAAVEKAKTKKKRAEPSKSLDRPSFLLRLE